jgi:hypothetical protein
MTALRILCRGALAALGLVGIAAHAAAACPASTTTSSAFAHWGDKAGYAYVPGGNFEQSLTWPSTGAPVLVAENDPFDVGGPGTSAVQLAPGQAIVSPPLCVDRSMPSLRFMTAALGRSRLHLGVTWTDPNTGQVRSVPLADQDSNHFASWEPSSVIRLDRLLIPNLVEVDDARLQFSVTDGTGAWLIDDVLFDPFKRG